MKKSTLLVCGILLGTLMVSGHLYSNALILPDEDPFAEELTIDEVKVYPNPSDGRFQLSFDYNGHEMLKAKVFDITGKLVKDISNDLVRSEKSVTANIDLENPGSGIYFIRIEFGKSLLTKKIIVR
jgi:hypothetical protein